MITECNLAFDFIGIISGMCLFVGFFTLLYWGIKSIGFIIDWFYDVNELIKKKELRKEKIK